MRKRVRQKSSLGGERVSNTDKPAVAMTLTRRTAIKVAGGLVATPAVLRVVPANAQSAAI